MKVWGVFLSYATVGVIGFYLGISRHKPLPPKDIARAAAAEVIVRAETVAETTAITIEKVRDRWRTVNIHDTIEVIKFRHSVDTLLVQCDECRRALDELRTKAAVAIAASCPNNDRPFGLWGGYGATKYGQEALVGWQIGAGVRLYPFPW